MWYNILHCRLFCNFLFVARGGWQFMFWVIGISTPCFYFHNRKTSKHIKRWFLYKCGLFFKIRMSKLRKRILQSGSVINTLLFFSLNNRFYIFKNSLYDVNNWWVSDIISITYLIWVLIFLLYCQENIEPGSTNVNDIDFNVLNDALYKLFYVLLLSHYQYTFWYFSITHLFST